MIYVEDPNKQIGYLQQCLSSDKKPLGLFLGAGCPMAIRLTTDGNPPLIPDITGITKAVHDKLSQCKDCGPLIKIVEDHLQTDGRTGNIEDILSHIRSLRTVAGKDIVRGLSAVELDLLDETICQFIHDLADIALPNSETPYHRVAAWVDGVRRDKPVEVFTTNYDLLMEQAFEDCRVPYFDGFAGARKPFFDLRTMEAEDAMPPQWTRLWKLHGSINWYQAPDKGVFRGANKEKGEKRVIHPSHLKYEESRRMPYLAMIDRLRAFLKQATATLVISGYSFRDEHLNEVLVQGLQNTQNAIAFALLFDNMDMYQQAVKLACERSNLTLLAKDGAVISSRQVKWPEKESEAISSETGQWVKWTNTGQTNTTNSKQAAEFQLGDFAVFGQFLHELIGHVRYPSEVPNAR